MVGVRGGLAWAVRTRQECGFAAAELGWVWGWAQRQPVTREPKGKGAEGGVRDRREPSILTGKRE